MPKTGEICKRSGEYRGDCGHTHRFDKGDTFTPCTYCKRAVTWMWLRGLGIRISCKLTGVMFRYGACGIT